MATTKSTKDILVDPLSDDNPITVQVLGICSALAVTAQVKTAVVMSLSVIAVMCCSSTIIFLAAFMPEQSRLLSLFVALIITNCIVMGRTEGFALQNPPLPSFLDAFANALGYSIILIIVGAFREVLGAGTFLGKSVMPEGYMGNGLAALPTGAFIIIGLLIWVQRTVAKDLVEEEN